MLNWLFYSGEVLQALLKMSRSSLNSYCLNWRGKTLDQEDSKKKKRKTSIFCEQVLFESFVLVKVMAKYSGDIASAFTPLYLYCGHC